MPGSSSELLLRQLKREVVRRALGIAPYFWPAPRFLLRRARLDPRSSITCRPRIPRIRGYREAGPADTPPQREPIAIAAMVGASILTFPVNSSHASVTLC